MNLSLIGKTLHKLLFIDQHIPYGYDRKLQLSHEEIITLNSTLRCSWFFWFLIEKKIPKLAKKKGIQVHLCSLMAVIENKYLKQKPDYYLSDLWKKYLSKNKVLWLFKVTWSFIRSIDSDFESYRNELLIHNNKQIKLVQIALKQNPKLYINDLLSHPSLWCVVHDNHNKNVRDLLSSYEPYKLCSSPDIFSYRLKKTLPSIGPFNKGAISYQDLATQVSIQIFDQISKVFSPKVIIDTCASPGGKTLLLQKIWPKTPIYATDLNSKKILALHDNINRVLKEHKITMSTHDWEHDAWVQEQADLILCDLPCSGSGVTRKHPEILWKKTQSDLDTLVDRQKDILCNAVNTLAPGGFLIIATCSILDEENILQIENLIESSKDHGLRLIEFPFELTIGFKQNLGWMIPVSPEHDGVYYCALKKEAI